MIFAMSCSEARERVSGDADVGGVELKEDATVEEASVGGVADMKLDSEDNKDNGSWTASAMMSAMLSTLLKQ